MDENIRYYNHVALLKYVFYNKSQDRECDFSSILPCIMA